MFVPEAAGGFYFVIFRYDRPPERECLFVPLSGTAMALRYAPANGGQFPPVTDWLYGYIVLGLLIPRVGKIGSAAEFSSSILPNA